MYISIHAHGASYKNQHEWSLKKPVERTPNSHRWLWEHYGTFSASPLLNSIFKVFLVIFALQTQHGSRCSHLAEPASFDQTAGLKRTNVDMFAGCCRRRFAPTAFYYFSTNALFAFPMLTGHLYLILSFFHFHFDHLCAEWTDLCPPHSNSRCVCRCKWSLMNSEWFRRRHVAPRPTPQKKSREGGERLSNPE